MDYERIRKTQITSGGGGFSPGKLRSMLLGVDRQKKEEMVEFTPTMRSGSNKIDDSVPSGSDDCKDVDVVSEITDCSTTSGMARVQDQPSISSGLQEYPSLDYDNGNEIKSVSASVFEFQKTEKEKAPQRMPIRSFSKPAPSKWDDAQKWIASPTSNRPKTGQIQVPGSKKGPTFGRQSSMKIVEVADQRTVNLSRHDSSIATAFSQPPSTARSVSMRDMGTEMTPIASQEPSRNGTPIRATTPIRSPISSTPSSPGRRASPMIGKLNIAAWASKEDEDNNASTSLKTKASLQTSKSAAEARASAWEEAEKAKHMARFRREELSDDGRILDIVEVERIKGQAQDRLMKKLAAIERKAEEKRVAASLLSSCFSFCS